MGVFLSAAFGFPTVLFTPLLVVVLLTGCQGASGPQGEDGQVEEAAAGAEQLAAVNEFFAELAARAEDFALLDRARAGDRSAFARLVERHHVTVAALIRRVIDPDQSKGQGPRRDVVVLNAAAGTAGRRRYTARTKARTTSTFAPRSSRYRWNT